MQQLGCKQVGDIGGGQTGTAASRGGAWVGARMGCTGMVERIDRGEFE